MFFPVPLALLGLVAALLLWCIAERRARTGVSVARTLKKAAAILVACVVIFVWALATAPVADFLLRSLEYRYSPLVALPETTTHVVVLGAGHLEWNRFPDEAQLGEAGLARVVEAVRLARTASTNVQTVFTGFSGAGEITTAEAGSRVATMLGMPQETITVLGEPRDTREEALAVAAYLRSTTRATPVVLVTSASHMLRAVREFTAADIQVTPAPAGYRALSGPYSPWAFVPSAAALQRSERAWYEYLGLLERALFRR